MDDPPNTRESGQRGAKKKAFPLRISPDLYEALERWAADELRSVNGQIEYLLWDAVKRAGRMKEARRTKTDDPD